ncbi:uncharacterized protein LOC131220421 [Magnolia sinica]|uniref:uncharacterized protein LOC131220421 n=1 Tax=Magnolia sinica TaxID=86752 RepID=UPI002659D8AB|nr:uncharacterized protein LOC131220421 [Magnolia sinica]
MGHIGYYRSRRGWRRIKGFRVNSGRLSVHRLRIRFLDFISFLRRWKRVCDRALNSLKKGIRNRNDNSVSSKRSLVAERRRPNGPDYKLRAYGRSNSFYAEAIADCLEFIKRSALVMDDDGPTNNGRITHTEGSWHASHEAVRITHHYVASEMHAEREWSSRRGRYGE